MKNIFTSNRLKIVLVLVFTYFSIKLVTPSLFLADSPQINPQFIANILETPQRIASIPSNFLASLSSFRMNLFNNTPTQKIEIDPDTIAKANEATPPPNIIFQYVSTGVSAAEDPGTGTKYIKVAAGTKYRIVGYITINGVKYPKIEFIK